MNEFTTQTNILMLRDIILENEETRQLNTEYVEQLLSRNLEAFYSKNKNRPDTLMQMNMEFLREFLYVADATKPVQITREQIQSSKSDEINNDLQKLQKDFEQHMKPDIPDEPVFADNAADEPVGKDELADIMRRTIAERNLEMSQIQTSHANSTEEAAKWITSTSQSSTSAFMETREQPSGIKTIKIQEEATDVELLVENISPLSTKQEKRVTWNDDAPPTAPETIPANKPAVSILNKLKQTTQSEPQPSDYITRKEFDAEINTMMEFLRERFTQVEGLLTRNKPLSTRIDANTQTPTASTSDLDSDSEIGPEDMGVD